MNTRIGNNVTRRLKRSIVFCMTALAISCATMHENAVQPVPAQDVPVWVRDLEMAFPARDWLAVSESGSSRRSAESAAIDALARIFKTDVESLTQTSQHFSEVISGAAGMQTVTLDQSNRYSQEVNTSTAIQGLIGVQTNVYQAIDGTYYAAAHMNRGESAARYSGMIREQTESIDRLLRSAGTNPDTLEAYASISFAYTLAQITDNFQHILEVLDPDTAAQKPFYGGAHALKVKMIECAAGITIGVQFDTEQLENTMLFSRAAGSFFQNMGFKINESGKGDYVLQARVRFEIIRQSIVSCRYYFDAALENQSGAVLFAFTGNERKAHPNRESEARSLAVRAVEANIKDGAFASEFDAWLHSLLNNTSR